MPTSVIGKSDNQCFFNDECFSILFSFALIKMGVPNEILVNTVQHNVVMYNCVSVQFVDLYDCDK